MCLHASHVAVVFAGLGEVGGSDTLDAAKRDDLWQVPSFQDCQGEQVQVSKCPNLPLCQDVTPVDCILADWKEWGSCDGHCTGLRERNRQILTINNEWGKPCYGNLTETKDDCPRHCVQAADCVLGLWSEWSVCETPTSQKTRERKIKQYPENSGVKCEDDLMETLPCSEPAEAIDCKLSEWTEFTTCSRSCDIGWQTRYRRIIQHALHGGSTCGTQGEPAQLQELQNCSFTPCPSVDCVWSAWTTWSHCDGYQRERSRDVLTPASNHGQACDGDLIVYAPCEHTLTKQPVDCTFGPWTVWTECDKKCGGGQQYRHRQVNQPLNGGSCVQSKTRETRPCNSGLCVAPARDCKLGNWKVWSACSTTCGKGQTSRSRAIIEEAEKGGKGCEGQLEEFRVCQDSPCVAVDCTWEDWHSWSGCTTKCGGGSKTRNRRIKTEPLNFGALCEAEVKTEIAPCNTQVCHDCTRIDGKWAPWSEWGSCTATCDPGYRKRTRDQAVKPSECGYPVNGSSTEFGACMERPCVVNRNCSFGYWGPWSDCSCPCYGTRERKRNIAAYSSGSGVGCTGDTTQVEPCNPGVKLGAKVAEYLLPPPAGCDRIPSQEPCEVSDWTVWSDCSLNCDGGQRSRHRRIIKENENGGPPCVDKDGGNLRLSETMPCNTQPCAKECTDCKWGAWTKWSACTAAGQKRRTRYIAQQPTYCGKPCSLSATSEISKCAPIGINIISHCVWQSWSHWKPCTATCGSASKVRERNLAWMSQVNVGDEVVFQGPQEVQCAGLQTDVEACPMVECPQDCVPVNCEFGPWSTWGSDICGLCSRTRTTAQEKTCCPDGGCGRSCSGVTMETKKCNGHCNQRQDCVWTDWTEFTICKGKEDQRYSFRNVEIFAKNGGNGCAGSFNRTKQCHGKPPKPITCQPSAWSSWDSCSVKCGGGTQTRSRYVQNEASHGGDPCDVGLSEVQGCNTQSCSEVPDVNCDMTNWGDWGSCNEYSQQIRQRQIATRVSGRGVPCDLSTRESRGCASKVVDCVMAPWTPWDACDRKCDGQQHRHRQVHVEPQNAGKSCQANLRETRGCSEPSCSTENPCLLGDWSRWNDCTSPCGGGQQYRYKRIIQEATRTGEGCQGVMKSVRGCNIQPCVADVVDCSWGLWSDWGDCSEDCGGGQKDRTRKIDTPPRNGGTFCDVRPFRQVVPCNMQKCTSCKDGAWHNWADWSECTASCGGGFMKRSRNIKSEANACGKPVEGNMVEFTSCNEDVSCTPARDCLMGQWHEWSACSRTCYGVALRTRVIRVQGNGNGIFCNSSLEELRPCNPISQMLPPKTCPSLEGDIPQVDCTWSKWNAWNECEVTCGGGQQTRARRVSIEASAGGKQCSGEKLQVQPCNRQSCVGPTVQDCKWVWTEWSACTKCSGQKLRFRRHIQHAQNGGKHCLGPARETKGCDERHCHQPVYCTWADWENWGACSAQCGSGRRSRTRDLSPTHIKPQIQQLYERFSEQNDGLRHRTTMLEQNRMQEMVLSFSVGALSLVVVLGVMRLSQGSSRHVIVPGARGFDAHAYFGFASANGNGEMHSLEVQTHVVE